jgi:antitoxin component YwqK of YwqJK toxin-antitoxin module
MATAFMELRVLSAINWIAILLVTASCSSKTAVELASFEVNQLDLKNINGVWHNGNTPFTGRVYALTPQGDSIFSRSYIEGLEDGLHKQWYPEGGLAEIRLYAGGKKTGINKGYWPDGHMRYIYKFKDDLYEGTQYEWYSNGKLYAKKNYHLGYEFGLQQSWNPDGSVKSNYEARNGRNYGNIGKKNCYSVWKDSAFVALR